MELLKEYIDHIIFFILGVMSFLVVWFSIERTLFYARLKIEQYPTKEELEEALSKNLTALYIIYSNAPYIGLLGTVVGIMITFYDMGVSGGLDAKTIMIGLSTALKATALGLLVAIPTLILYNVFLRKVDVCLNRYQVLCVKSQDTKSRNER
ncbi:TonB-system energizer ExbB [uncultured Helicobacter sp.]|uniref:TonB-system energizer ExbB n=1 Tax=uncultured Helicobacter sp. TaxID=175537 RepID=UPI00374FD6CF